ncbi:hypothetical protein [Lentzea sp. NBRC 102530]|uniref:hypothetical protein n=1 Tax=Lentzea sp. NBRC 102530 TaxID=3032201 RepID=UPI00249FD0AE|nr:hypothetical protein [Lentzea sp. NBRC 102530]GLY46610.1 hypothetical protein Lesp01_02660 [Lentzea sp. NBRC 102530]
MAKHAGDGTKRPGTPGPRLPQELGDFKEECPLGTDEKEFVIEVCRILREHPTRNSVIRFVTWLQEQDDQPAWARRRFNTVKNALYESLNCTAKHLPSWSMVAWIVRGTVEHDREAVEERLGTEYVRLTGEHPAPDTEGMILLLRREIVRLNAELADRAAVVESQRVQLVATQTRIAQLSEAGQQERRWRALSTELALAGTRSANHMAVTAAWLDAHGIMHADFNSCVRLLNVEQRPGAPVPRILAAPAQPSYRAVTRWITVHLRAFILSRYDQGLEAGGIDDPTGQLNALVQHGTLPSAEAVAPLLHAHQFLERFVRRLLEEAEAEDRLGATVPEQARASGQVVLTPSVRHNENVLNGETVFLQIFTLPHRDMTDPDAANRVIAELRALESRMV